MRLRRRPPLPTVVQFFQWHVDNNNAALWQHKIPKAAGGADGYGWRIAGGDSSLAATTSALPAIIERCAAGLVFTAMAVLFFLYGQSAELPSGRLARESCRDSRDVRPRTADRVAPRKKSHHEPRDLREPRNTRDLRGPRLSPSQREPVSQQPRRDTAGPRARSPITESTGLAPSPQPHPEPTPRNHKPRHADPPRVHVVPVCVKVRCPSVETRPFRSLTAGTAYVSRRPHPITGVHAEHRTACVRDPVGHTVEAARGRHRPCRRRATQSKL